LDLNQQNILLNDMIFNQEIYCLTEELRNEDLIKPVIPAVFSGDLVYKYQDSCQKHIGMMVFLII